MQRADNLNKWEERFVKITSQDHFVLVAITKRYCIKIDSNLDSGCKREFQKVLEILEQGKKENIILTYLSDEGDSYNSTVTGDLK